MKNEVRICFVKMLERILDEIRDTEYAQTFDDGGRMIFANTTRIHDEY